MDNGFKILERLINFTKERHGVIASNIANVDTPGYKAKDLRFENVFNDMQTGLMITDKGHINTNEPRSAQELQIETGQSWIDKNNVELDVEVAKMTENAIVFQTGIALLSKKIKMFKDALRSR